MPPFAQPIPSLQPQLDRITANTRALVPPERLARTEEVIAALRATGIESHILSIGSSAPNFSLIGANNKPVRSADLLALGPVVLKFFRGRWCPYDMTELEAWQALYPELRARGALLVAISPQTPRQNAFTAEQHKLTFPLLADPCAELAAAFGLAYTVPEPTRAWYRSMLVNIPFLNGEESWRLPLPATVLLKPTPALSNEPTSSPTATIAALHASADHRLRAEPQLTLAALAPNLASA